MPKLFKRSEITTITVGELIAKLSEFPVDMTVAFTWEGQILPVDLERVTVMQKSDSVLVPVLLLDADTN